MLSPAPTHPKTREARRWERRAAHQSLKQVRRKAAQTPAGAMDPKEREARRMRPMRCPGRMLIRQRSGRPEA